MNERIAEVIHLFAIISSTSENELYRGFRLENLSVCMKDKTERHEYQYLTGLSNLIKSLTKKPSQTPTFIIINLRKPRVLCPF